jgi:hypothetical protein
VDEPDVVEPEDFDELDELEPESDEAVVSPDDVPAPASAGFVSDVDDRFVALRSFFAQPDPLKWTAGVAIALRTSFEWQTGHDFGPSSWTPWTTSNRCPQWWQT